jgi:YidC/Oxa1 family membrane protein insertase
VLKFLGQLIHPLFEAMAWLISFSYALIPNYAVAIALVTLVITIVLTPFVVKSVRSMAAQQVLAPKIKELQRIHKGDRNALAQAQMQLYQEEGVHPLGGCLPMLLPFPLLFVLYDVIRGLTNQIHGRPSPKYISGSSALYQSLIHGHGTMVSFGMNLATSATRVHGGLLAALPYFLLVLGSAGFAYLQQMQTMRWTGQNQNSAMMKIFPLILIPLYIAFPAGLNVYMFSSSLFRYLQYTLLYKYDPGLAKVRARVAKDVGIVVKEKKPDGGPHSRNSGSSGPRRNPGSGGASSNTPPARGVRMGSDAGSVGFQGANRRKKRRKGS